MEIVSIDATNDGFAVNTLDVLSNDTFGVATPSLAFEH